MVAKASPSVVSIVAKRTSFDPFRGPMVQESGIGTGFVIDKKGTILTNKHVVSDTGTKFTVLSKDGKTYNVLQINLDPSNDLAILKTDATDLDPIELGDSDGIKLGQTVVAIGNALGRFTNTVTKGVVSGIGRGITASASPFSAGEALENVIQTDAALNPGNSGGPLIDLDGRVIGVNVAIASGTENIGFSIPINTIKPVLEEFEKSGKISRPFIGIEYILISKDVALMNSVPEGAYVKSVVTGSAAEEAGLLSGDIITEIDGEKVNDGNPLAKIIQKHKVGDRIQLSVDRNGNAKTLSATLKESATE
ncbi:hypothetical protein COY33_00425 [candidate division WWE3 bacterium CG_4_10_14_0_2_um_filter_42_7]|uniref:PDZ domain-containing protein n=2 Tax=Katanobacteria TaxID=422282 RepID=A0A2H0XBM6_UNCKA|nr:MAG: hypothetical protein COT51_02490 [candidate division WWE3 bacterium CG08_land_8_20_14_0_20_41_15]PIZ43995.1 MAG: hypothetical protein COY33_00425 [candidate division WWE3 bacterium CG_4_10_14_0_2_um_filter_42_7]